MSDNLVRYRLSGLPPLTEAQKAEIEELKKLPESEIDCSDIPEASEAFFAKAVQGRFCRPG
ncbi:MAG: hypothetical protein FWD68_13635 [Alphaproteobacteria bacterium]|nr:hypothetical protein [Alphaproteobacteria bacterium]